METLPVLAENHHHHHLGGGDSYGAILDNNNNKDRLSECEEGRPNNNNNNNKGSTMTKQQCPPLFQAVATEWAKEQETYEQNIQQLQERVGLLEDQLLTATTGEENSITTSIGDDDDEDDDNDDTFRDMEIALFSWFTLWCAGLIWYHWHSFNWVVQALVVVLVVAVYYGLCIEYWVDCVKRDKPLFCVKEDWPLISSHFVGAIFGLWYGVHQWGWSWQILQPAALYGMVVFPICVAMGYLGWAGAVSFVRFVRWSQSE